MKILVVSDTHGKIEKVKDIFKELDGIDLIVHCGDHIEDARNLGKQLGVNIIAVAGNCDGSFNADDFKILETECGNLLVTHGHMQNVDCSQENLLYFAESKGCIGALYGHTHRAAFSQIEDMYLMNPGSLTRPRDGSDGSYGIIQTSENGLTGQIVYVGQKKKTPKGRLRDMLNYSDRF